MISYCTMGFALILQYITVALSHFAEHLPSPIKRKTVNASFLEEARNDCSIYPRSIKMNGPQMSYNTTRCALDIFCFSKAILINALNVPNFENVSLQKFVIRKGLISM